MYMYVHVHVGCLFIKEALSYNDNYCFSFLDKPTCTCIITIILYCIALHCICIVLYCIVFVLYCIVVGTQMSQTLPKNFLTNPYASLGDHDVSSNKSFYFKNFSE